MKKIALIIVVSLFSFSCKNNNYNLEVMGKAVERHFKYNDEENEIHTVIETLKPISYSAIDKTMREQPNDAYLCKVYVKARWSYLEGSRVFNINDTLDCYFDQDLKFNRIGKVKE